MSSSDNIKKALFYVIPLITIVVFLLILTSSGYFLSHSEAGRQIPKSIDRIEKLIQNKSWEEAANEHKGIQNRWNTITPKIQISVTEDDIKEFSKTLVRLETYLKNKEQTLALAEIRILRFTWEQLEN